MGCDIHIFVERKNKETGKWEVMKGENPSIARYYSLAESYKEQGALNRSAEFEAKARAIETGEALKDTFEKLEKWYPKEDREKDPDLQDEYEREFASESDYNASLSIKDWIYDGRNYDLFAILANVRNGYGFAGCDTGDGFVPISNPKDLPSDVSDYVKKESDRWDGDGHSHSYLTVKELLDYDWNQTTVKRGIVGMNEYENFKERGYPESYSGGVGGGGVAVVLNEEMDALLNDETKRDKNKSYYTQVSWKEKYHETCGDFYTKSLPVLKELAGDETENIRIVFWFDN